MTEIDDIIKSSQYILYRTQNYFTWIERVCHDPSKLPAGKDPTKPTAEIELKLGTPTFAIQLAGRETRETSCDSHIKSQRLSTAK